MWGGHWNLWKAKKKMWVWKVGGDTVGWGAAAKPGACVWSSHCSAYGE